MRNDLCSARRRRAFTLVEVLLVLVILVTLASLVLPNLLRILGGAQARNARIAISQLETAVKTYILDVGVLPNTLDDLCICPGDVDPAKWNGPYLEKGIPLDPWNKPYQYTLGNMQSQSGVLFEIWTTGEKGEVIGNWTTQ